MNKLLALIAVPLLAVAHPMGNFSINHYCAIQAGSKEIDIRYVIDMAEIPTFQEMQQTGISANVDDPTIGTYLSREQERLRRGLAVTVNGHPQPLYNVSRRLTFPPGAGGLPTMRMLFSYRIPLPELKSVGPITVQYQDRNFPDRIGWKEVIASASDGARIRKSSVPEKDRSLELTSYPTDLITSPPQAIAAQIEFVVSPPQPQVAAVPVTSGVSSSSQPAAPRQSAIKTPAPPVTSAPATPRNAFTELISQRQWSFWFLFTAALVAAGLGGMHALEPGHGKTMVAAYLVGSRGTAVHACLLGLIVTASHTAGVYLLGAVVLYASRYIVPEQLYPWLGAASGLTIAGLGVYLLHQRWRGQHVHHHHHHDHPHSHAHDHHAHGHQHHHPHPHASEHAGPAEVSKRQLFALGITGGIVPCPAALVVLLSAVALHRIAFGLFLIVAFSFGLAAVLIAIGLMVVYARRFMSRVGHEGPMITRWLPIASAVFIAFLGFAIALRSLSTAGILKLPV
jgi:ABC-type nickel/cobalt efflux system permease component RcnA